MSGWDNGIGLPSDDSGIPPLMMRKKPRPFTLDGYGQTVEPDDHPLLSAEHADGNAAQNESISGIQRTIDGGDESDLLRTVDSLSAPSAAPRVDDSRLRSLQAQQDNLNRPMSMKQKLIKALIMGAPIALAGAFGGLEGAGAAASGVNSTLRDEESERNREMERLGHAIPEEERNVNEQRRFGTEDARYNAQAEEMKRFHDMEQQHWGKEDDARNQDLQHLYAHAVASGDDAGAARYLQAIQDAQKQPSPRSFNLEEELNNALGAKDQSAIDRLTKVQKIAHPPASPTLSILPTATGGIGGLFNNKSGAISAPPDTTAAPGARKFQIPANAQNREIQADAIKRSEQTLFKEIDANAGLLGPWAGRWQNIHQFIGDASPEAMKLKGRITSHWSLIPAMHSMRSAQVMKELDAKYGQLKFTPESLKAVILGVSGVSQDIKSATEDYYGQSHDTGDSGSEPDYVWDGKKLVPR